MGVDHGYCTWTVCESWCLRVGQLVASWWFLMKFNFWTWSHCLTFMHVIGFPRGLEYHDFSLQRMFLSYPHSSCPVIQQMLQILLLQFIDSETILYLWLPHLRAKNPFHHLYSLDMFACRPGAQPLGQADDMCIRRSCSPRMFDSKQKSRKPFHSQAQKSTFSEPV